MGALCCGGGSQRDLAYESLADVVRFDEGPEAIFFDGPTVSGTGAVLANSPIQQTKAFFEVRIQKMGKFGIGIATSKLDQSVQLGDDEYGWGLTSDSSVKHKGEVTHQFDDLDLQEGGFVGVSYDQSGVPVLNYFFNGKNLGCLVISVKGNVYPALSVSDGAELEVNFTGSPTEFAYPMTGFDGVFRERSLV